MAKRCPISKKAVMTGNIVSHANNKTRRRFMPNLQSISLLSEKLGSIIRLRLSTRGLRTIDKNGGVDAYLLKTPNSRLTKEAIDLKKKISSAK